MATNKVQSTSFSSDSFGRFDFVKNIGIFGGISLVFTILALGYLSFKGLNYGIDFKGGTEMQVKFSESVTIDHLRTSVSNLGLGDVGVQAFGEGSEFIIRFQGKAGANDKETNDLLNQSIEKLKDTIETDFKAQIPDIRRVDTVGPQVGAELKRNGLLAFFYGLLVILIYIAVRFDYKYAPGAVLCLFHDAVISLAIFNIVGKEVNVPIMAAILSLIGYSLNDTIVVFDRIRETEGFYREKGSSFIINKAINNMLMRTLITSGSTFVSALCLYIFAGGVVEDIAFVLSVGVLFGTYSSIYVAAPFIIIMEKLHLTAKPVAKAV